MLPRPKCLPSMQGIVSKMRYRAETLPIDVKNLPNLSICSARWAASAMRFRAHPVKLPEQRFWRTGRAMSRTRLFGLLAAISMILAPLAMVGGSPGHAMALSEMTTETMMAGHCSGQSDPVEEGQPCGSVDCISACMTIAVESHSIAERANLHSAIKLTTVSAASYGRTDDFEPPPPRLP